MTDITQQSYNKKIKDLAYDLAHELLEEYGDREEAEENAYDRIHETVDGHQWVIYTYKAGLVSDLSDNAEAWLDCYDGDSIANIIKEQGMDGLKPIIAYFAMTQDISEAMKDAFDWALQPEGE